MSVPRFSIIIVTRQGENTVAACIDSLLKQNLKKELVEIIVVDNARQSLEKELHHFPICYIPLGFAEDPDAFNVGLEKARGDYIAFTHNDCIVAEDWLERLYTSFQENPQAGIVGGKICLGQKSQIISDLIQAETESLQKNAVNNKRHFLPYVVHANAMYLREVIERAGKFDPLFIEDYDVDLSWRVFLHGYKIVYCEHAKVDHFLHRSPWAVIRQNYRIASVGPIFAKKFQFFHTLIYQLPRTKDVFIIHDPKIKASLILSTIKITYKIQWAVVTYVAWCRTALKLKWNPKWVQTFSLSNRSLPTVRFNHKTYGIQPEVIWRIYSDEARLLHTSQKQFFTLNDTAYLLWKSLIDKEKAEDEVLQIFKENFGEIDEDEVREDISEWLDSLVEQSILYDKTKETEKS